MADALVQQIETISFQQIGFEDRVGLLVEHEWAERENRKLKRLVRSAGLPEAACLEEVDYRTTRNLDKSFIATLSTCEWVRRHQNLTILGATGLGKTWLGCAFATQACRLKLATSFYRASDLFTDIAVATLDGSLPKLKAALAKPQLLVLDDFGIGSMTVQAAHVLLDVVDQRMRTGSLLITSQYPTDQWHGFFPDPTIADAVLDRVIHQSHRIQLKGESMRKLQAKKRLLED
jgi:DNA replication protein DnaC